MDPRPCPLCGVQANMRRAKSLYGHGVCKKCYNGFANRRQFAFIIDSILIRIIGFPLGFALGVMLIASGMAPDEIGFVVWPLDFALVGLFFCKDGFTGRSPGKAICGVRVVDKRTGRPAGFGASFMRNLPLLVPFMPLVVAVQLCHGQRWGDGWAHTRVVWTKYATHPIFTGAPLQAEVMEMTETPVAHVPDDGNPYRAPLA